MICTGPAGDLLRKVSDEIVRFDFLHLLAGMRRDQAKGLGACGTPATDACRGIFDHETAGGVDPCTLCAQEVRIRSVGCGKREQPISGVRAAVDKTYSGLPFSTSSDTTKTSGTGMPAAFRAAVAYEMVAEVQIAHFGFGSLQCGPSYRSKVSKSSVRL